VAFAAVVEVCIAKGALPVMAGQTTLRARVSKVLRGARRCHLLELWNIAARAMAIIAAQFLSGTVLGVAEAGGESARVC
jgi:hypothetical protein